MRETSVLSDRAGRVASFQVGCHATYWLRPVQGTTVVFAFFGKECAADDVSITRTRRNASASARRAASRSPSR
jgi:hypothetical protein